jgi:hypothetical protein
MVGDPGLWLFEDGAAARTATLGRRPGDLAPAPGGVNQSPVPASRFARGIAGAKSGLRQKWGDAVIWKSEIN